MNPNLYQNAFDKAFENVQLTQDKLNLSEQETASYYFIEGIMAQKLVTEIESMLPLVKNDALLNMFYSRSAN